MAWLTAFSAPGALSRGRDHSVVGRHPARAVPRLENVDDWSIAHWGNGFQHYVSKQLQSTLCTVPQKLVPLECHISPRPVDCRGVPATTGGMAAFLIVYPKADRRLSAHSPACCTLDELLNWRISQIAPRCFCHSRNQTRVRKEAQLVQRSELAFEFPISRLRTIAPSEFLKLPADRQNLFGPNLTFL